MYETKCGYKVGVGLFDARRKMLQEINRVNPKAYEWLLKMDRVGMLGTSELQGYYYKAFTLLEIREHLFKWSEENRKRSKQTYIDPNVALLNEVKRRLK